MKTYIVTPQENRLNETVLMMGYNIPFDEGLPKITPEILSVKTPTLPALLRRLCF